MELLRLVAMLSVILFHLDFLGMGIELHFIEASPLSTILGAVGLKSLTMSCVNLFVLVSGWYGIRFTLHKLGTLVFQVLFYSLPIYLVIVSIGRTPFCQLLPPFVTDERILVRGRLPYTVHSVAFAQPICGEYHSERTANAPFCLVRTDVPLRLD